VKKLGSFRRFRDWCPQPPDSVTSKLKRSSATPKYIDLQIRNKWAGFISIIGGFASILIAVFIFLQAINNYDYTDYTAFYNFWFPLVSFCFVASAFFMVIGIIYLRNIRGKWSYASIAAGCSLIAIVMYELAATIKSTRFNGSVVMAGWDDFQQHWSLDFFSGVMAACFFIVLGIILGLKVKNKLGYVIITGGFAVMFVGISVLAANLATSLNYYPPNYYFSLQVAWNTTISYSLIAGASIVAVGTAYLLRVRNRMPFSFPKEMFKEITGE
jgi:hypothetical protein